MTARREKGKPQKLHQESVADSAKKEDHNVTLEAGKFCLDIAKLVFGGVILAGIMQQGIEFNSLFISGLGVVLLFFVFGLFLIKKSKTN